MKNRLNDIYRSMLPSVVLFMGFSAILWVGHRVDRGMRIFRRDAIQSIEKAQQSGDSYYRSRFDALEQAIERLESKIDSMEERTKIGLESNAALSRPTLDSISTAGLSGESLRGIESSEGKYIERDAELLNWLIGREAFGVDPVPEFVVCQAPGDLCKRRAKSSGGSVVFKPVFNFSDQARQRHSVSPQDGGEVDQG